MYGNYNNRGYAPQRPPVSEGEELDVRIEAVGEKGDGVAKKDGFVLFVPNVKEGDNVRIRVTKVLRKVGFAEVIGEVQAPVESPAPKQPSKDDELNEIASKAEEIEDTEDFGDEESSNGFSESASVDSESHSAENESEAEVDDVEKSLDEESSDDSSESAGDDFEKKADDNA